MGGDKRKQESSNDLENITDNLRNTDMHKKRTRKIMKLEVTKSVLLPDSLKRAADSLQKFEQEQKRITNETDTVDISKDLNLYHGRVPRRSQASSNDRINLDLDEADDDDAKDEYSSLTINPNNKIYNCSSCVFICTQHQSLVLHQAVHTVQRPPYSCTKCHFECSNLVSFNRHVLNHYADKPYWCELCDMYFISSKNLFVHKKKFHPCARIKCEKCNFSTYLEIAMKKHVHSYHSTEKTHPLLKCQVSMKYPCAFLATKEISLQMHQHIIHTTGKPYQCNLCEYKSYESGNFNVHILTHYNDRPFYCPHCFYRAYTMNHVDNHIKKKHAFSIIRCKQCDFIAFLASTAKEHKEICHTEKPCILNCPQCSFIATKQASLELHKVVHNSKRPFQCGICEFKSSSLHGFNEHILSHNLDKPYICPHCSKYFSQKSYVIYHVKLLHSHLDLRCAKCNFTTVSAAFMNTHQQHYHSDTRRPAILTCEKCDFIYTKPGSLPLHEIVHNTHKPPYRCTECGYQHTKALQFNKHILTHNRDKPHFCHRCIRCFTNPWLLKTHVLAHHPDAVITCEYCDFVSGGEHHMDIHNNRVHSKDKKRKTGHVSDTESELQTISDDEL